MVALTQAKIDELKKYSTPTVCNAIELFKVRRRDEGFLLPHITCRFPDLGVMVGYAATATFRSREPASNLKVDLEAYYEHVLSQPAPRILVAQDLDNPPIGALFGEVNASVHKALGCVGHVTNGGVRDLDECHRMGFHFFSGCIQVSHAYAHLEGSGRPVEFGGTIIHPGDLLHGDKHGMCIVPGIIADELAEACRAMEALERPLIILSSSPDFSPGKYAAARAKMIQQSEIISKRFSKT